MKKVSLFLFLFAPLISMESTIKVVDGDSGDEPSILEIIRADRATLICRPEFNELAMITKKSMSPENDAKNGTLKFKVIKDKNEVLGFTAYHATDANKVQIALVAVDKKYRNQKLGQRLFASTVQAIRAESKEPVEIWAYVAKDNDAAQCIWKNVAGNIPHATLQWEEGTGRASDAFIVHLK